MWEFKTQIATERKIRSYIYSFSVTAFIVVRVEVNTGHWLKSRNKPWKGCWFIDPAENSASSG